MSRRSFSVSVPSTIDVYSDGSVWVRKNDGGDYPALDAVRSARDNAAREDALIQIIRDLVISHRPGTPKDQVRLAWKRAGLILDNRRAAVGRRLHGTARPAHRRTTPGGTMSAESEPEWNLGVVPLVVEPGLNWIDQDDPEVEA